MNNWTSRRLSIVKHYRRDVHAARGWRSQKRHTTKFTSCAPTAYGWVGCSALRAKEACVAQTGRLFGAPQAGATGTFWHLLFDRNKSRFIVYGVKTSCKFNVVGHCLLRDLAQPARRRQDYHFYKKMRNFFRFLRLLYRERYIWQTKKQFLMKFSRL